MFRKLLGLATGALLVAAFGVGPFGGPATSEAQAPAMSSVIISFNLPPRAPEIQALSGLSAQVKGEFPMVNAVAADVPTWAVPLIGRIPAVKLVEPDVEVHATTIASELSDSWGVERIGAGPLHAAGKTGAGVRVAILDTGIATGHPDLAYDPSCSFGSSDNGPTIVDGHNHGTHVAGTIAGKRNGTGVVGVAPGVTLCIFKVLANSGSGSSASILAALQWIQNYNTANPSDPIRVTSNSYGANTSLGSSVEAAFNTLNNAGVLNIAAAGNNGNSTCIYPALYASVVSVGSTTSIDAKSSFSSFCADVELAAPGSSVYSTVPATGYATMSGTSMATPHASGSAALLFGAFPNLTNNQVRSLLQSTALDLGTAGRDTSFGFGLVQPAAAIEAAGGTPPPADNPVPVATSLTPASVLAGSAAFTLEVRGSGFISSSVVRLNGSSRTTTFVNTTTLRASISSSDVSTATTKTVTVSNPTPGGGTSSGLTLTISSTPPPPPPPPPPGSALYLSLASSTTVGGVSVANEDIFQRSATGTVSILFDGSDVGLSSARLDAFQVLSATQVLISLSSSATLTGLGTVDDSDILLFTGTLGSSTSGTLTMFFDGSGSGLTTSSEDVDGIYWDAATSKLYLSTSGSFTVTGLSGGRSDIFSCNGFAAGGACSSFSLYFDGDDIGLSGTSSENIDAFTIAPDGTIYFSLGGAFDLNGALAGAAGDVVACGAPTLGGSSACGSLTIVLAASSVGGGNVTGVDIP